VNLTGFSIPQLRAAGFLGPSNVLSIDTNTNTLYLGKDSSVIEIDGLFPNLRRELGQKKLFFDVNNKEISGLSGFVTDIAVNPNSNLLYVVNHFGKRVSEIDPYSTSVLNNFTLPGIATDIAVNPETNMVYVTNRFSDTLSVINLTENTVVANVSLALNPSALAINPETNMIYVADTDSSTVSVINGRTNKVTAGVNFNVNPPNAGFIQCNGQKISRNYTIFDTGTAIECEAIPSSGFQFSSWFGDLVSSTSDNTTRTSSFTPFDSLFGSWFNSTNNNDNAKTTFTVSKHGALSANFINPVQITIPWELLAGIILSPIVGWSIPFIADRERENKRRKNLAEFMMKNIDDELSKPHQNIAEYQKHADELRKKIQDIYTEGKINESSYKRLNNKVSEYEQKPR